MMQLWHPIQEAGPSLPVCSPSMQRSTAGLLKQQRSWPDWTRGSGRTQSKLQVYQACVLNSLLYSSEAWTTYAVHERKLNSFHLRCLLCILCIQGQEKLPNTDGLRHAGISSIFTILSERRFRWLGHDRGMDPGHIPRDTVWRVKLYRHSWKCRWQNAPLDATPSSFTDGWRPTICF